VPIHKQIPFLPWIKIPAATITFSGKAQVMEATKVDHNILNAIYRSMGEDPHAIADTIVIEFEPVGEFVTVGMGVSTIERRTPATARGRAPGT
jgi:hypothetical protein